MKDRERYTDEVLKQKGPYAEWVCNICGASQSFYSCKSCIGSGTAWCLSCCLQTHQCSPFHSITKWNGNLFQPFDMDDLGLILYAGHHGKPCPCLEGQVAETKGNVFAEPLSSICSGDPIQIVSTMGIFVCHIQWCYCLDEGGQLMQKDIQLLRMKLYPATSDTPGTAFTFDCLKDFHLQAVECKTAALKYITKIRHRSSPFDSKNKSAQVRALPSWCYDIYMSRHSTSA